MLELQQDCATKQTLEPPSQTSLWCRQMDRRRRAPATRSSHRGAVQTSAAPRGRDPWGPDLRLSDPSGGQLRGGPRAALPRAGTPPDGTTGARACEVIAGAALAVCPIWVAQAHPNAKWMRPDMPLNEDVPGSTAALSLPLGSFGSWPAELAQCHAPEMGARSAVPDHPTMHPSGPRYASAAELRLDVDTDG